MAGGGGGRGPRGEGRPAGRELEGHRASAGGGPGAAGEGGVSLESAGHTGRAVAGARAAAAGGKVSGAAADEQQDDGGGGGCVSPTATDGILRVPEPPGGRNNADRDK